MRKLILSICMSLLFFGIVNAQVDIKQVGYHKVMVADTVYSQHSQEYQAQEMQLNLKLQGIDSKIILAEKVVTVSDSFWDNITSAPDTIYKTEIEYVFDTVFKYETDTLYVTDVQYDTVFIANEQPILVNSIEYDGKMIPVEDIFFTPETVTDTIYAVECFEDYNQKTWLWTTPESVWIPFKEIGLAHVTIDSMPIWKKKYQNKYKLQRVKNHKLARADYKELEMPFQFMWDSIVSVESNRAVVRVFANEDWYPDLYVDDQLWKSLPDATPGSQDFDGFMTRRHTITFDGLLPNTNYVLAVRGYSRLRKEEDIVYFTIKTL